MVIVKIVINKKKHLIILLGESGSGKDEFLNHVSKKFYFKYEKPKWYQLINPFARSLYRASGGDLVKKVAYDTFKWNGIKDNVGRILLGSITNSARFKCQHNYRLKYNIYALNNQNINYNDTLEVYESYWMKTVIDKIDTYDNGATIIYSDMRFIDEFRFIEQLILTNNINYEISFIILDKSKNSKEVITDEEIYSLCHKIGNLHSTKTYYIKNNYTNHFYDQIDLFLNLYKYFPTTESIFKYILGNEIQYKDGEEYFWSLSEFNNFDYVKFLNKNSISKIPIKDRLILYFVINYLIEYNHENYLIDNAIWNIAVPINKLNHILKTLNIYKHMKSNFDISLEEKNKRRNKK